MLNKAILMGRLTRDPELRRTQSDIPVVSFSLAVDRNYKNGDEKKTDFIDCVAWRQKAEFIEKWLRKGMMAAVVGAIEVEKWQDKDGNNRYSTKVNVSEIFFGESKKDSGSATPAGSGAGVPEFPDFDGSAEGDDELPF